MGTTFPWLISFFNRRKDYRNVDGFVAAFYGRCKCTILGRIFRRASGVVLSLHLGTELDTNQQLAKAGG